MCFPLFVKVSLISGIHLDHASRCPSVPRSILTLSRTSGIHGVRIIVPISMAATIPMITRCPFENVLDARSCDSADVPNRASVIRLMMNDAMAIAMIWPIAVPSVPASGRRPVHGGPPRRFNCAGGRSSLSTNANAMMTTRYIASGGYGDGSRSCSWGILSRPHDATKSRKRPIRNSRASLVVGKKWPISGTVPASRPGTVLTAYRRRRAS